MGLKEKVTQALRQNLQPDHIRLDDDDGISGIVVSTQFRRVPALERQMLIDRALRDSAIKFSKAELRQILAIAGLTPAEYSELGLGEKGINRKKKRVRAKRRNEGWFFFHYCSRSRHAG